MVSERCGTICGNGLAQSLDPIHTDNDDDELQLEAHYYYDLRDGTVIHIIVKIPLELITEGLFEVEKVLQKQL